MVGTQIQGRIVYGVITAFSNSGTNTSIKDIGGYTTENSGTATIASGATSIVVTHGLAATPTRVFINPTNSMGSAANFYVDTLTATQFTIHTDVDPGATTSIFNWRAVIGEGN